MLLTVFLIILLFEISGRLGADLNSLIPRTNCYPKEQPNCCEEFTDRYPELSMSSTNLTKADTYFLLFTRKNPDDPEKLHKCGGRLPPNSNFNPKNRLIMILNPYIVGICDIAAYREWAAQILIREDANVMLVDYSWGNHVDINTANSNIKIVAKQTVIVLQNIKNATGIKYHQIYLIGQSLAAQLAGLIGHSFHVGRITGLDPGGPGYRKHKTPPENRLDCSDADLVDVWHTNMGDCLPQIGINEDVGHVDFIINGGRKQEGCYKYAFISLMKQDYIYGFGTLLLPDLCYHAFSSQYFKVSINPESCQFVGVKCDSYEKFESGACNCCGKKGEKCMIMGFDLDKFYNKSKHFHQRYYVKTSLDCPYCIGDSELRLQGYADTYRASLQHKTSKPDKCD